jgi:membrane protein required for colicin V production
MTWVDGIVIAVLVLAGVLAFMRGFVREALGIAAWIGAAYAAYRAFPFVEPRVRRVIDDVAIADPVALAVVFIVALIVFSLIAGWFGRRVRYSSLGGIDRSLGFLFGLAKGAAIVVAAYIIGQRIVPVERWPAPVLEARALPFTYKGAKWVVSKVPEQYRPRLEAPPARQATKAADLLQANPQGYAVPPPATPGTPATPAGEAPKPEPAKPETR